MKKKTDKSGKRTKRGAIKDLEPKTSPKGGAAPGEWFSSPVVQGVDLGVQLPSALKINFKK